MDDRTIKDEVLQAENVIRGLARHMQDERAATLAAESAQRSLSDATNAVLSATARLDGLCKLADGAIARVDSAARELTERSNGILAANSGEMTREYQGLREARAELSAAAQTAVAAAKAANEKAGELAAALQSLNRSVSNKVVETGNSVASVLSQEIKTSRNATETLHARLEFENAELKARLGRYEETLKRFEETLKEIKLDIHQVAPAVDALISGLHGRMQEARVKAAAQTSAMEANIMDQVESTNAKTGWVIVLEAILAAATVVIAAKLLMH